MSEIKGIAATAIIQGSAPAAMLVGCTTKNKWSDTAKGYTNELNYADLYVVSPNNYFKNFTVRVDGKGYNLNVSNELLDEIAESGKGNFPTVAFSGLSVTVQSNKESNEVIYKCKATAVFHCDLNGKPLQQKQQNQSSPNTVVT